MTKIKIVTSRYETKMEELINNLLLQGYKMEGKLSTYDKWMDEGEVFSGRRTGHRIQVTFFLQIMSKED